MKAAFPLWIHSRYTQCRLTVRENNAGLHLDATVRDYTAPCTGVSVWQRLVRGREEYMTDSWLERDCPYSDEQDLKDILPNSLCFSLVAEFF
jgi:hypothetical protein